MVKKSIPGLDSVPASLPTMATGTKIPDSIIALQAKQAQEEARIKDQRRHDWKIAAFGVFGGAVAGFVTSIIFWSITK